MTMPWRSFGGDSTHPTRRQFLPGGDLREPIPNLVARLCDKLRADVIGQEL
jgi:hypothetical protein